MMVSQHYLFLSIFFNTAMIGHAVFNIEKNIQIPKECITNVANGNYPCGSTVSVVYAESYMEPVDDLIKHLSQNLCYNIITRTFDTQDQAVLKYELYVFIVKNTSELLLGLSKLTKEPLWNPHAKYIVFIPEITNIAHVFKLLNGYYILNTVFIKSDNRIEELYTYYPFANGKCGNNIDAIKLGNCRNIDVVNKSLENKNLETRDKSQPCKIRIGMNENIPCVINPINPNYTVNGKTLLGLEQYILTIIASIENFDLEFTYVPIEHRFGVVLDNGTSTGLLKYLQDDVVDIVGGGFILIKNRADAYDYVDKYNYGSFYAFTAVPQGADWKMVYKEFSMVVWILIAVFYIVMTFIFMIANKLYPHDKNDRTDMALKLWGYFFSNTNQLLPNKLKLRKILACWIWFTFFINNFYNTEFYRLLASINQNQHVNRVDESYLQNYKPCLTHTLRALFKATFNMTFPENTVESCGIQIQNLDTVAARQDLFAIEIKFNYIFREWRFLDEQGNPKLETRDFSRLTTTTALFIKRGFVFKEVFQKYIDTMVETGLVDYQLNSIINKVKKTVHSRRKVIKGVDLKSVSVAFALHLFGLLLAIVIFIAEKVKII